MKDFDLFWDQHLDMALRPTELTTHSDFHQTTLAQLDIWDERALGCDVILAIWQSVYCQVTSSELLRPKGEKRALVTMSLESK